MARRRPSACGCWRSGLPVRGKRVLVVDSAGLGTRGKPVLLFGVPGASYQQRFVSGYSHRSVLTKLGGARNPLVVAVANGRLIVRPFFPLNLMFLSELYGLEYDVPLDSIVEASVVKRRIDLELRDTFGQRERISLYVRNRQEFLASLGRYGQYSAATGILTRD